MQSSTIRSSWRLSSFSLENLITKTYKGNNEYTKLNHIRICNHRIALLSFVWRVFLSLRSWRVAACFWFPCPYHNTALPNRQLYYSHQYNSILPFLYLASVISVPLFPLFFSPVSLKILSLHRDPMLLLGMQRFQIIYNLLSSS